MRAPPDIPRCVGLPPGAPCPAHNDNSWPEGCDCYMQYQPESDWNSNVATTLVVCVLAAIGLLILLYSVAYGSDNQPDCMTRGQARAAYPDRALYWRSPKRCWYAGQIVRNVSSREKTARPAPRPARHAVKTMHWDEFNELDAAADRDTYFNGESVPVWRLAPIPHPRFLPWDERIGM